jgi:hypothetical protein
LEALLANLTDALQLPPGALTLDILQQAGASTSYLAISSSPATGTKRLLLAGGVKPQMGPVHLTATLTLCPDSVEAAGGDAQLSAAWMGAVLEQVIAEQPASDPVRLDGVEALARWGRVYGLVGGWVGGWKHWSTSASCTVPGRTRRSAACVHAALLCSMQFRPSLGSPASSSFLHSPCRSGVCGNGICEVAERTVQGLLNGTCPQDCAFETKVGGCERVDGSLLWAGEGWS